MSRKFATLIVFSIVLSVTFFFASVTHARTIIVDCEGSGDFLTIQEGLDSAVAGDTILVLPGEYRETLRFPSDQCVLMSQAGPNLTVVNGEDRQTVIDFPSSHLGDTVVEGFTITGGQAEVGGGISCSNSSPTIKGNRFIANHAMMMPV